MSEIKLGGSEDHLQTAQTKKEKKEKKDKEKKDKEKKKKRGGSRIERLSRVVKEKVQGNAGGNDSTDDEAKVDTEEDFSADESAESAPSVDDEAAAGGGGDGVMEGLSSSAGASPTTARRLTMAQVKDRSLSAQAKRKRSATDGATGASLLGSFRRPGGASLHPCYFSIFMVELFHHLLYFNLWLSLLFF